MWWHRVYAFFFSCTNVMHGLQLFFFVCRGGRVDVIANKVEFSFDRFFCNESYMTSVCNESRSRKKHHKNEKKNCVWCRRMLLLQKSNNKVVGKNEKWCNLDVNHFFCVCCEHRLLCSSFDAFSLFECDWFGALFLCMCGSVCYRSMVRARTHNTKAIPMASFCPFVPLEAF